MDAHGRANVVVLTVDHALRAASADEARFVKDEAQRLGFAHRTMTWQDQKPEAGLQCAAREARYRLMHSYLLSEGLDVARALVTAHHQDDQAETFLMRLGRGSGVDGLSGMASRSRLHDLAIVRPLLGVAKSRLVATLVAAQRSWIDDPTNEESDYERVRLRKSADARSALGLTNQALALSARRLARARAALNVSLGTLAKEARLTFHDGVFAECDYGCFHRAPEEFQVRLLGRLLSMFSGGDYPVRLSQIEDLVVELAKGPSNGITLAGAIVVAREGALRVFREPGREGLVELQLCPGEHGVWDGRFHVALSSAAGGPARVSVGPLGSGHGALLSDCVRVKGWPQRAVVTLPAFRSEGTLLSVPHLSYVAEAYKDWANTNPDGFCVRIRDAFDAGSGSAVPLDD